MASSQPVSTANFLLAGHKFLWLTWFFTAGLLFIPEALLFWMIQLNSTAAPDTRLFMGFLLGTVVVFIAISGLIWHSLRQQINELQESRARNRVIVDNMADAVININSQAQVLSVNRAGEQLFGYSSEELRGKPFSALLAPAYQPDYIPYLQQIIEADAEPRWNGQQIRGLRKNGSEFPLVMALSKTRVGSYPVFTALIHDMTEHQQALDAMAMMRDVAETANHAKSQFLSNMSHELRTPLNGISGMLELLQQSDLNTEQLHYLTTAQQSSEALLNIISAILDFSVIEMGKVEILEVSFNLKSNFEEIIALFVHPAQHKNLALSGVVQPEVPAWIVGDPFRLRQILTQLLDNAIKFTAQGEIVATVRLLPDSADRPFLRFEVKDSGIGIAPADLQRLFAPFSQADESNTRNFGGIGLGLTIAKRLVELQGGDLGFDSQPGVGSRFWFSLPLKNIS